MIRFVESWLPGNTAAMVIWPETILVQKDHRLNRLELAHELRHIVQLRKRGYLAYLFGYAFLWLRYGYQRHPWEVEAKEAMNDPHYLQWAQMILDGGLG